MAAFLFGPRLVAKYTEVMIDRRPEIYSIFAQVAAYVYLALSCIGFCLLIVGLVRAMYRDAHRHDNLGTGGDRDPKHRSLERWAMMSRRCGRKRIGDTRG